MRLNGKVAIVTGAASGIGRATALLFAREGAQVVVADCNDSGGELTVRMIERDGKRALFVHTDVSRAEDVQNMVGQAISNFGRLDVLVNNAAVCVGEDILEMDEGTWDLNLAVDLKGPFLCSRAALPEMIKSGGGSIVNIASVNALMGLGHPAYSAAKAGLISLTQNMAVTYGPYNVRVNCICPGTVRTEIWQQRLEKNPRIFEQLAKWYPLKRVGTPEEIAYTALFLASDESSFATGAVFVIDGGLTAGIRRMAEELRGSASERREQAK